MKRFFSIGITAAALFLLPLISGFRNDSKPKPEKINGILWRFTTWDFGNIPIGPDATKGFVFKNKKKTSVTIKSVEPGCSCTVSDFTPGEIKKNKEGKIIATYRTKDRPGYFKKFIKVTFEDGNVQELVITGNVVFPETK